MIYSYFLKKTEKFEQGGRLVGKSNESIEVSNGGAIINKRVLATKDKMSCEGTPLGIASEINQKEGGKPLGGSATCSSVKHEDSTELNQSDPLSKIQSNNHADKGGLFEGNSHSDGGIKVFLKNQNKTIEVEGGEALITENTLSINQKVKCSGSPLGISSALNELGGGNKFSDEGVCEVTGASHNNETEYSNNENEFKDGGMYQTTEKFVSLAPEKTVFVKVGSHRTYQKAERTEIPFITLYNLYANSSAGQSVWLIFEKDYDRIKDITGVSAPLKSLPSKGMKWNTRFTDNKKAEKLYYLYKDLNI